jgi:hypothetical protein
MEIVKELIDAAGSVQSARRFGEFEVSLEDAIFGAREAIRLAIEASGSRPTLFLSKCKFLLSQAVGLEGDYVESEDLAKEVELYCSIVPMNEKIFSLWANAIICRSAALDGLGKHREALSFIQGAKNQISSFPGVTEKGKHVFDQVVEALRRKT